MNYIYKRLLPFCLGYEFTHKLQNVQQNNYRNGILIKFTRKLMEIIPITGQTANFVRK